MAEHSDKKAKLAFCRFLKGNGYNNVKIINTPVDISAYKNDKEWLFEIKKTSEKKKYFGAATITEMEPIIQQNIEYRIVIAQEEKVDDYTSKFVFYILTLDQFLEWGNPTIPPFKIYFNVLFSNVPNSIMEATTHEKEYVFSEEEYANFKKPLIKSSNAVPFRKCDMETLINFRKKMYNICKHLIEKEDDFLPNSKLYYCKLLEKAKVNNNFFIIKEAYESFNKNAKLVQNGECPWRRLEECRHCPLWEFNEA